jgi:hypothetical protein
MSTFTRLGALVLLLAFTGYCHGQSVATATLGGTAVDGSGAAVPGVVVTVNNKDTALIRKATTGADGSFTMLTLPPGNYALKAELAGFASFQMDGIVLHVGDQLILPIALKVGTVAEKVNVESVLPVLETETSSTGSTILPKQIEDMPINGRNYSDLLQLVPGVALNRQQDPAGDDAVPILGERAGNTVFLIDGLPNRDEINGGAAAQFNQDSILEFQVLTSGYKAEFGHGSGGVVNVVSKSGTNDWHGGASLFHRNYELDSSDIPGQNTPFLLRWDTSAQFGGPIVKDRVFFFGSAERIRESRDLNFQFPPSIPEILQQMEAPFNLNSETYDTRVRAKLDEQFSHHRLSEQMNLTNTHVTQYLPLTQAFSLPSLRSDLDSRHLMVGFSDTATLGDQANPTVLSAYFQYRGEPSLSRPANPEAGIASVFDNLFSSLDTGDGPGNLGQVMYGPGHSPLTLDQKYVSAGANLAKQFNRHTVKFGWDFMRTLVDGNEANNYLDQLWSTESNLALYGPLESGIQILSIQGGLTPQDDVIRLRDNYDGLFVQDDWKVRKSLTLNVGLRWDYDSEFPNKANFSPRIGFAWSVTPRTVIRASYGIFYDHFRLGIARDIPAFGGANLVSENFYAFPDLFYGNPSQVSHFDLEAGRNLPCLANDLTDAQIAAQGLACPYVPGGLPYYGINHLNDIVAPGHAPIPANTPVSVTNVQSLTGLTPTQFANAASTAIGQAPGYFTYDVFGALATSVPFGGTNNIPITVDPNFRTPYTQNFSVAVQRQLSRDSSLEVDYYHKDIRNILGERLTNIAFAARLPGNDEELQPGTGSSEILGYGPWFQGTYDAVTIGFQKRMSKRFTLEGNYTWTHAIDNVLNSNFVSNLQTSPAGVLDGGGFVETDSFLGVPPVVTEPTSTLPNGQPCGGSNATGPFTACNGNPVPQAGKFYNGANVDKGPSDLSLKHTFLLHGIVELPWKVNVAGIFRAQSGFPYSELFSGSAPDVDGGGFTSGFDFLVGRNRFTAPPFVNMDLRVAKRFALGEHARLELLLEYFNLFNRANPAAVQTLPGQPTAFGTPLQVLPGREGQVGFRVEF